MNRFVYLDHAAATPISKEVMAAMMPYFADNFYNASAEYLAARRVRKDVTHARETIAHYIGARPSEIIFTAGGTEANNLAIQGVIKQYPAAHSIISAVEHDSVRKTAAAGIFKEAPVKVDGRVDIGALKGLIDESTVLISVQYVNNEIGTIQPISEIAQLVAAERQKRQIAGNSLPILLHTDACQAPSFLPLQASRLGVDLMTLNAGKIYGPKQVGALYINSSVQLSPIILGGGHEKGYRSGTENVAGIIGFATALRLAQDGRHETTEHVSRLRGDLIEGIMNIAPNAVINGSLSKRVANNVHVTFLGVDNESLMMQLDEEGIQCAVGSACKASSDEPSHVLKAIGLSDEDAQSSIRFSLGKDTTDKDIAYTLEVLGKLLA